MNKQTRILAKLLSLNNDCQSNFVVKMHKHFGDYRNVNFII